MTFSDVKTFCLSWRMRLLVVVVALFWGVPPLRGAQGTGCRDKPDVPQAIAQLEEATLAIRLCGIEALGQLAKDSEKDPGPILAALTAYVRENAPRREEDTDEPPPPDIQAILTVIGRRATPGTNRRDDRLNLRNTHLAGADLGGADLHLADLGGADLHLADLGGADLGGANLRGANLGGAFLRGANLSWADLGGTDLRGANLRETDLRWTDLGGANLRLADLRWTDLRGTFLRGADLRGTFLRGADLDLADRIWASGRGTFLRDPDPSLFRFDRRGAKDFPTEQDWAAKNWRKALRLDEIRIHEHPPARRTRVIPSDKSVLCQ